MIPAQKGGYRRKGSSMLRVDGNYLYAMGSQIHPLSQLTAYAIPGQTPSTYGDAITVLQVAESALEPLLYRSVFRLRTSQQVGEGLLAAVRSLKEKVMAMQQDDLEKTMDWLDTYMITAPMQAFEAVLGAELALQPLYVVSPKGGYDIPVLVDLGFQCFPDDLPTKAPEAVRDIMQGTRCIAFDLPTAAGFHLHRANEAVLRRYWDAVANGAPRPNSRNMGDYLKAMDEKQFGDEKVRAALRHLKDFHRNPLIHPEESLDNADDAIALMNSIHTVVRYMLKDMPIIADHPFSPTASTTPQTNPAQSGE